MNRGADLPRVAADMDMGWISGWSGVAFSYGAVQAPMIAGLVRGRAGLRQYLSSPFLAVPLTLVAGIGVASVAAAASSLGLGMPILAQVALGTAFAGALGYTGGRVSASGGRDSQGYRRGALVDDAWTAPHPMRSRGQSRITIASQEVSLTDETKHFKLIGTTGTGKSTAIHELLGAALARGDRAVIADPDGGYVRRFHDPARGDVILNPFDERSVKWNLFGEIRVDYDVDQLARSLIPDQEGSERSWRAYARTFLGAVTRQAHEAGIDDVKELYRLLVVAEPRELRGLVEGTAAQPFLDEHNGRMFDSIRSVASSAVAALDYVSKQEGPGFSIRDWVSGKSSGVLFMPYKAGQIAALRSSISAWMRLAIFETMNQDEQPEVGSQSRPRRLWFVVDELDALGPIDGLKDALARLRKFGGRCVLGFQSVAQVSSSYGQGDAHTIVENCGNTLILRCSASEGGGTARFASQLIGDREVSRTTVSTSRRYSEMFGSVSHGQHVSLEPAVLPAQIEQLADLSGYWKSASSPRWRRVRLEPPPDRASSGRHDPAYGRAEAGQPAATRRGGVLPRLVESERGGIGRE